MLEREKLKDVPGQPGSIQNTRRIIHALRDYTPFSGTDAGELLSGLDRLEAETEAEKVLKAPQVQDARGLVSSMRAKGFIPKESADRFFAVLKDPETVRILKREVLPVTKSDSQVTKQGMGRRRFLVGAGATIAGIGLISIFTIEETNRQEAARQETARQEAARAAEALRQTEPARIERAKELLGKDFLGTEAVRNMESKLKGVGVNAEFILNNPPPFPYTEEDLSTAKAVGEMLVLRPEAMLRGGREVPLTLIGFRELFRKDPLGKMQTVVYSFRADANDWYKGEKFATQPGEIKLGWSLVKKDVLDGSTNTNWNVQEQLLRQYETDLKRKGAKNASVRRRTATEAVYDELLYYVNTGERLLPKKCDWTQTRTPGGFLVSVGGFGWYGHGVIVELVRPEGWYDSIGVCSSR